MAPLMISKQEPILVAPAEPTPNETKLLSDIDDQHGLRFYMAGLHMFASSPSMEGQDPVSVIRDALARALVFYYPIAGRIAQGPGGKLAVDCTGEGVHFTVADADVRLDQSGEPSFPTLRQLVPDVPAAASKPGAIGHPVLFMQVTRLRCGGFVLGNQVHHSVSDAAGIAQFLEAVGEMARGAAAPSVLPAWSRELLTARNPPVVTHLHREYEEVLDISTTEPPSGPAVNRSFFFSASDIAALRRKLPDELRAAASVFDVITATAWRCRTAALRLHPEQEVRAQFAVNTLRMLRLPAGYYGNTIATPVAASAAGELCGRPLGYAVELVRGAKRQVTAEYTQSVADLMAARGRPRFVRTHTFLVSDITRIGFKGAEFGWGPAAFIGTVAGEDGEAEPSYYTRVRDGKGEDGVSVTIHLPDSVMARFADGVHNELIN